MDMYVKTPEWCEYKKVEWGITDGVFFVYDIQCNEISICMDATRMDIKTPDDYYSCGDKSDFDQVRIVWGKDGVLVFLTSRGKRNYCLSSMDICLE